MFILIFIVQVLCDQLILSQILWRHGARTPLHCNWNCEEFQAKNMLNGYLTPTGMRQHYVLGNWLRKRYIQQMQFLSATYNESEIYIESTDVNRTIVSAMSNLQGMYPNGTGPIINSDVDPIYLLPPNVNQFEDLGLGAIPQQLQVVPVHVREKKNDIYLRGYDQVACPRNIEFIESNLHSELYQEINNASQSLIKDFSTQMKLDSNHMNISTIYEYYDTLETCEFNGYKQPILSVSTTKKMKQLSALVFSLEHFQTFEQVKLIATPFLNKVLTHIQQAINGSLTHKFRVFSAHDTTVALILNALNFTSVECMKQAYLNQYVNNQNCIYTFPGYASNIIFELYKNNNSDYYVQILYNGTVMPICGSYKCSFQEFESIIINQNVTNYEEECLLITKVEIQIDKWIIILMSVGATTLFFISLCAIFLIIRQRRISRYSKTRLPFEA